MLNYTVVGRLDLKCDDPPRRTGREVKGKLANAVGSQYPSHYLGTWCIQHYYRWFAHLGCQYSTELTPRADLNGLVRFAERRNLVFACAITYQKRSTWQVPAGISVLIPQEILRGCDMQATLYSPPPSASWHVYLTVAYTVLNRTQHIIQSAVYFHSVHLTCSSTLHNRWCNKLPLFFSMELEKEQTAVLYKLGTA